MRPITCCPLVSEPTSAVGGPIHGISIFGILALWSHQGFQLTSDLGIKFSRKKKWLSVSLTEDSVARQCLGLVCSLGYVVIEVLPFWQHYLCWSDVPVPRISVIFSLEELKEIEKDCAVYVGRMERVARHSCISKEEKVLGCRALGFLCTFTFPSLLRVWADGAPSPQGWAHVDSCQAD
jgi:hypothetical protein